MIFDKIICNSVMSSFIELIKSNNIEHLIFVSRKLNSFVSVKSVIMRISYIVELT